MKTTTEQKILKTLQRLTVLVHQYNEENNLELDDYWSACHIPAAKSAYG